MPAFAMSRALPLARAATKNTLEASIAKVFRNEVGRFIDAMELSLAFV